MAALVYHATGAILSERGAIDADGATRLRRGSTSSTSARRSPSGGSITSAGGKLHFLELRDGHGMVQCVMAKADVGDEAFAAAGKITQESSIMVTGEVRKDKRPALGFEVDVKALADRRATDGRLPHLAQGARHRLPHGSPPPLAAVARPARHPARAPRDHPPIRDFFDGRGFTLVDAPIFTPNACEGTSNLFETDYHGEKAYLTQSGQLYMEAAAAAVGRIYCFGPTFRAEKSKTRRHLAEFWMVEPEVAFMDLDGDMDLAEDFLVVSCKRVLENRRPELAVLERDVTKLEQREEAVPAHPLRRGGRDPAQEGQGRQVRAKTSAPTTRRSSPSRTTARSWSTAIPTR